MAKRVEHLHGGEGLLRLQRGMSTLAHQVFASNFGRLAAQGGDLVNDLIVGILSHHLEALGAVEVLFTLKAPATAQESQQELVATTGESVVSHRFKVAEGPVHEQEVN